MDKGQQQENAAEPRLCVRGCGFFANPACMDMCSKCYREVNSAQKRDVTEMQTETQSAEATSAVNLENTASVCDAVERSVVTPARTEIASRAGDEHEAGMATPSTDVASDTPGGDDLAPKQKNRSRCFECRKKVGLVGGFECKCGFVFCSSHRMPDEHACKYDFKTEGKQRLAEENQEVRAARIERF